MNEKTKDRADADNLEWCPTCKTRGTVGPREPRTGHIHVNGTCPTCNGHGVVLKQRRAA